MKERSGTRFLAPSRILLVVLVSAIGPALFPARAVSILAAEARQLPDLSPATASTLLAAVRSPKAKAVLVNVWATWCQPCREEFPDILRLRQAYEERGLRVVLVSGDFPSDRARAVNFLAEHGVDFPTYIKDGDDMAFIDGLNKAWSGALPATFLYDTKGSLLEWWEGKASYSLLEKKVLLALGGGPPPAPQRIKEVP